MSTAERPACRYLLGAVIVACLTAGGGTVRGLAVDSLLQIAILIAATCVVLRRWDQPASRAAIAGLVFVACTGGLQLVPLPTTLFDGLRPEVYIPGAFSSISLASSRTLPALGFALCAIYLFLALSKLGREELEGLVPFVVGGVLLNLLVVFLTYSNGEAPERVFLFGDAHSSGLFANDNHLSTLLCASMPLVIYLGLFRRHPYFASLTVLFILVCLLAIGSRAGILTGLAVLLMSLLTLLWRTRTGGVLALGMVIISTIYGYSAITRIGGEEAESMLGRADFARTTLEAISENWVLGTGYGSFDLVYPRYERPDEVYSLYVNHAHNDFLEVVLEGGLIAAVGIAAYLAAIAVRLLIIRNAPLKLAAFLSVCVVLVHSTVDYPLRTMAIASIFAFVNAVLFAGDEPSAPPDPEADAPVTPVVTEDRECPSELHQGRIIR